MHDKYLLEMKKMTAKAQEGMKDLGRGSTMENTEGRIQKCGESKMGQKPSGDCGP